MRLKIDQTEAENLEWRDEMRPNNAEQEAIVEQNFKQCTEIGDPKYMGVCPRPYEDEKNGINDVARALNSFVL